MSGGMFTFEETGLDAVQMRLEQMPLKVQQSLRVRLIKIAAMFINEVKTGKLAGQMVRKQTGNLAASVRLEQQTFTDTTAAVVIAAGGDSVGVKYARFVEEGTGPHEIVAKNGKALRFMAGGNAIFRKRVKHPGTAPRPFMGDTMIEQTPAIRAELEAAVREGMRA